MAFVNESSLVGDTKQLHLPRFDVLSISDNLLDSPSHFESTHAKTIEQLRHGGDLCT